ncbi:MAG: hypothetical protein FWE02_02610 [Defluviitaleaceae bacterium]|nr:hypothetical protein [Defluviitaleaceae bacterium]
MKMNFLFGEISGVFTNAKIQGFKWGQTEYELALDEQTYLILALRYKELFASSGGGSGVNDDVPYDCWLSYEN